MIGILVTLKWFWVSTFGYGSESLRDPPSRIPTNEPEVPLTHGSAQEGCPWNHVFADITNRLQLLEVAFKEQAAARELISLEVNNQSNINSLLNSQLTLFLNRVEQISLDCRKLEKKFSDLSTRIQSDGM